MYVDVDTLVFLELLAGAELTLMLLLVGRLLRGEPGLVPWGLGVAAATAGSLATALGLTFFGSLLLALAPALVWAGARDFCGLPRFDSVVGGSVLAVAAILLFFTGPRAEQLVVSLSAACWSVAIVWTLLRGAEGRHRAGASLAVGLFALHGFFQLARAFFPLPEEANPLLGVREWPRAIAAMGAIFFAVAWTFAVLGLTSQRLLGKLREAARTDGLTALLNRRAFLEDGCRALEFCRRRDRPCAVILADLDHFKRLNDTEGHVAGDRALVRFASTAARMAKKGMVLGRYGGEEFCFLLPGADREQARSWAEQLRAEVARSCPVTVSLGIAVGEGELLQMDRLIAAADEALYRAKAAGRDQVCA